MSRKAVLRPEDLRFDVDVMVPLPRGQYKVLYQLGRDTGLTIAALVRECVRRQLDVPTKQQRRPVTDEERQHIFARHAEGARIAHIAFELGRPSSVVHNVMTRAGLTANHGRGRPTNDERRRT